MADPDQAERGRLQALVEDLYPICRSITGPGLRETLERISREIRLVRTEIPSGTPVLDWEVPLEWSIEGAYMEDPDGRRVVDFRDHNLHVVNYSVPVDQILPLEELRPHLHSLPDRPDWIPYRTSYYKEDWGLCLPHRLLETLPEGDYRVRIDSALRPGTLSYGEHVLKGETEDEVLVSVHCCHPSLANDNLSGIATAVGLALRLSGRGRRLTYRFVFIPGTIGAIAWLDRNRSHVGRIRHGIVLTCVGDRAPFTYKRSRRDGTQIDRAMTHLLVRRGDGSSVIPFEPYGYDERQYCSPGFDLPVGCLMRSRHGRFPEYHTSADNLEFLQIESVLETVDLLDDLFRLLEADGTYRNVQPFGEPQLGRRGLYGSVGGTSIPGFQTAMLWVLSFSDGRHSLLDIAVKSGLPFEAVLGASRALREAGLLASVEAQGGDGGV